MTGAQSERPSAAADTLPFDDGASAAPIETRSLIARGIIWNSAFQVFLVGISFVSMLVLVRLLSPKEYGRAAAVTGVFAVINCFNCGAFIAQAIQLPTGKEPDWTAHWRAGFQIQFLLCLVCNAVAGVAWLLPAYRPIAPILHVASIGLLIDVPSQVAGVRLRRAMNFRTLRLVHAAATIVTVVSGITLALIGAGAYALIISSNVLHGAAFGFYLLIIERWRPSGSWFGLPDWTAYRAPMRFGAQQSGSAVMAAARGLLESLVIAPLLGYEALGLLNRAQVLFTTTVGRVTVLVIETVYPMLPRSAADPAQFARHATLFVQTMLLLSIPGAIFVGLEGPQLSRLLYGAKWAAADPLIWPGTIFAWGVATVLVFAAVLQAQNRLRLAFLASVITASFCLPAISVAALGGGTVSYAWGLAFGQTAATLVVVKLGSTNLQRDWFQRAAVPPAVAAAAASTLVLTSHISGEQSVIASLCGESLLYGFAAVLLLRLLFVKELREVTLRIPAARWFRLLLRLT